MTDISMITGEAMVARYEALADVIRHTPLVWPASPALDAVFGPGQLALKLECLQHTGTFKARGALSVARSLTESQVAKGITAASAGNHAIAAAWAARQIGVPARVVMQNTANPFRVARAHAEGAEILMRAPGAETMETAERLARDDGLAYIHPFEGPWTTLGASGVGREIAKDWPWVEAVVVAVGGGGLMSGVAAAIKAFAPAAKVYGVEPEGAASVSQSLQTGAPVTLGCIDTIADSLSPPFALPFSLSVIAAHVDAMVTVSDDQICAGMAVLQEEAKLAVEPAAGAAMAAALGPLRGRLAGKKTAVVVCGSNIDSESYATHLMRGADHAQALLSGA